MLIIFFSLLLLFPFLSPINTVLADDFDITGDARWSLLKHTTAISVASVPDFVDGPGGLLYEYGDLEGTNTQDVVNNENIYSLTHQTYMRRASHLVSRVSGPPGTEVDVLYLYTNEAGHSIDVSKVAIPFSQRDESLGNWLKVSRTETGLPQQERISVPFDYRNIIKEALLKEYLGPGELQDLDEGVLVLDTLEIKNPLKVLDVEVEGGVGNEVNITVEIENLSEEVLHNIHFEHLEFSDEFTIQPYEIVTIQYAVENPGNLGYFKIHNPNVNSQCAIYGNGHNMWFVGNGVTVLAFREDGGWVNGATVQPEGDTFCISRIPYTMTSQLLEYEYENGEEGDSMEVEDVSTEVEEGEEESVPVLVNEESFEEEEYTTEVDEISEVEYILEGEVLGVDFELPRTGVVR